MYNKENSEFSMIHNSDDPNQVIPAPEGSFLFTNKKPFQFLKGDPLYFRDAIKLFYNDDKSIKQLEIYFSMVFFKLIYFLSLQGSSFFIQGVNFNQKLTDM